MQLLRIRTPLSSFFKPLKDLVSKVCWITCLNRTTSLHLQVPASITLFLAAPVFILLISVLHQLDQKIIYPHCYFKHLTEKYFEIGMKLNDFSIQLVKY